ncbi:MAG: hypothetical protein QGG25_15615 [Phycisphaerae bacterium]|nr:hypothetical protein [Phycisphaerae bacterium]
MMNDKQIKRWEKIRRSGRLSFIWIRCATVWGLLTAILWSAMMQVGYPQGNIWRRFLLACAGFVLGGYFLGVILWRANEKRYKAFQDQSPREQARKPDALES